MQSTRVKLYDYVQGLSEEPKSQYKQKLSFVGGVDLFLGGFSYGFSEVESWPPVDSCVALTWC